MVSIVPKETAARVAGIARSFGLDVGTRHRSAQWDGRRVAYMVDLRAADLGHAIVRVANFADDRGRVHGDRGLVIADLGDDSHGRAASHHSVADVVGAMCARFGIDGDRRDEVLASLARGSARGVRSAGTRAARHDSLMDRLAREVASQVVAGRARADGIVDLVRSLTTGFRIEDQHQVMAGARALVVETANGARLRAIAAEGGARDIVDAYSDAVRARLAAAAKAGESAPEVLRALVWDAFDGFPLEYRVGQADMLRHWADGETGRTLLPLVQREHLRIADYKSLVEDALAGLSGMIPRDRVHLSAFVVARRHGISARRPFDARDAAAWSVVSEVQHRLHWQHKSLAGIEAVVEPYRTNAALWRDIKVAGPLLEQDGIGLRAVAGWSRRAPADG